MDNKDKFTDKARNYMKYRPSYPQEFVNYLTCVYGINKKSIAADIGAGTGIMTKLLADKVKKIFAVEPNQDMITECRKYLTGTKNCQIVKADAEDTTLPDCSIDFITVAQAFHWFDREKAKTEFKRILKTEGKVIIIWNFKNPDNDFFKENSAILKKFCPDFKGFAGGIDTGSSALSNFFKNGECDYRIFDNDKSINFEEFIGGILSASYSLSDGNPNYDQFISELTALFNKHCIKDKFIMHLKTCCFIGQI